MLKATLRAGLVLTAIVVAVGGLVAYSVVSRGLSAHDEPSGVEEMVARAMRRWATPQAMRNRSNPVQPTTEVLEEALEHYADHCALCHANDGSGETKIGRGLYPKAPDMRAANTQSLSDGELFSIIEHGIRLTGMPGWATGTPEGERNSWGLVRTSSGAYRRWRRKTSSGWKRSTPRHRRSSRRMKRPAASCRVNRAGPLRACPRREIRTENP